MGGRALVEARLAVVQCRNRVTWQMHGDDDDRATTTNFWPDGE